MNEGLPKMGELLREMPPVIAHMLDADGDPYQTWFPTDEHGESIREQALAAFKAAAARPDLKRLMPFTDHVEKRNGTPPHPATGSAGAIYLFGGVDRSLNPNADFVAPIWFGERVRVRMSSLVVGPVLIADDVHISSNVSVVRSIIGPRSRINDGASLKYSIVGADCWVSGDLLSEQASRTNGEPIRFECWVRSPDRLLPRRLRVCVERPKMGCVIGDGCRIGKGVQLMPGTVLMPGVIIREDAGTIAAGVYDQEGLDRYLWGR